MKTVQSVVKKDVPPTPEDTKMTVDHTADSITYNHPHAKDHLNEMVEKAQRLKDYDPAKAKKLVKHVLKEMRPIMGELEKI